VARIAGVDLPKGKRTEIALTRIFGIGRSLAGDICEKAGIPEDSRVNNLTEVVLFGCSKKTNQKKR